MIERDVYFSIRKIGESDLRNCSAARTSRIPPGTWNRANLEVAGTIDPFDRKSSRAGFGLEGGGGSCQFRTRAESVLRGCTNLPRLASYVFMYSLVMNCETRAVLPTPESPSSTTLYLETLSSMSLSVLAPCPLQQEPSNGDLSPDTLLFLRIEAGASIENFDISSISQTDISRADHEHETSRDEKSRSGKRRFLSTFVRTWKDAISTVRLPGRKRRHDSFPYSR